MEPSEQIDRRKGTLDEAERLADRTTQRKKILILAEIPQHDQIDLEQTSERNS